MPTNTFATQNPSNSLAAQLPDVLSGIRAKFCTLIVDRVLTFESLRKSVASADSSLQAIQAIAALAHKIAGVAATLGFQQVGDLAATLELRIDSGTRSGLPVSETWQSAEPVLDELLDELEKLLED